ncbi:InlB B-repeat-containing protein [Gardnerella vaginalis]|uniref:InlB B-repeat-containing protein n=1 Tax=Gardnerella vaginalis TaxID=2702 RepID=UPI001FF18F3E|nr:InlB B-repeat-containing protein [Gardnerella vaginalis]
MGKRTNIILTSTMMGIATTACAFCMAQSANAAETSASSTDVTSTSTASSSANVTVDYSKNNSSITTSNTETSSTTASSIATASIASSNTTTSNTTNGGGSALDSASAKPAKFIGEDRSMPASEESREASTDSTTTNDPSLAWTREDFNISADGKTIGGRKDVHYPDTGQTVNEYVDGLSEKGKEKLKKNHHIVIPEGIEVIHECAFTGHAKQVGNKQHEHIDGETYIEGVTLPQSLKIIEYGAFGWNKIKGTVTIPKNVISIHSAAFVANEIEKVVFEGVLDGKGKEHDTDADPYYLAGVGEKAFQGNKISEIVVKDNLGKYKLYPSNNPQKSDSVFDNQNPGPFTIEVGEEYKSPIKITQESGRHTISIIEGFKENGSPVQIENSSYFQKNNEGKYVATQPGTLQGQCLFYDIINGQFRVIGTSQFTYNILPKSKIYTVTFVNDTDQNYAKVQVKEGKTINNNSVLNQVMPDNPSKAGYTFRGWSTDKTGKDKTKEFSAATQVTGDMTVYAIYTPTPAVLNAVPTLIVQDKTITEGDPIDPRSLIVSATDKEDGNLKNKVQITNNGGFDNSKVGSYVITFSVTDNGGATATASATVTVTKKPTPPTPPTPPAPAPEPEPTPTSVPELSVPVSPAPILTPAEAESEPEPAPAPSQPEQPEQQQAQRVVKHLPKTGSAVSTVINYLFASVTAGIFAFVEARKSLRRYSKHARKN